MSLPAGQKNQLLFWRAHIRGEHRHAPRIAVEVDANLPLIKHRGQIRATGLVVETDRHQGHLVDETEAVLKAPAEQFAIAGRQQKSAPGKALGRTNQRLQHPVVLGHRMGEEPDIRGVGGDLAMMSLRLAPSPP